MRMHQLSTVGLAIFTYLLVDEKSHQCLVIDPTRCIQPIVDLLHFYEWVVTDIVETHVHADFLSGAKELKHFMNGQATIHCSGAAGPRWVPYYADHILQDRDEILVGSLRLQAWHTPGHTPEHMSYLIFDKTRAADQPCVALTGDFLFVGGLGRPDLLGNEALASQTQQLYHSVMNVLPALPDYLEIFPAHGAGSLCGKQISGMASSTLGYERQANALLKIQPQTLWVESLLEKYSQSPRLFFKHQKNESCRSPTLVRTSFS